MNDKSPGRLEGRVAVVTGGGRGLGEAIAKRFLDEGAKVAVWDIDALVHKKKFSDYAESVYLDSMDVSDPERVDRAADRVRDAWGHIDILVNNAGVALAGEPWDVDNESWRRMMSINADGAFWCSRACLPDMRAQRYGKIINVSSIAALNGRPSTHPAYASSKAAMLGMTASLSNNLGTYGICVNAILPGFIRTEIHDDFSDEQIASFGTGIPLSRRGVPGAKGLPEDIANAALYLASDESDYVTGVFLNVNGGAVTG